jgi:hypothetical protein
MSKSLKQEQDELFAGLEDILPTKKQLSFETRNANPVYIENLKKGQAKIKNDPEVIANRQASADKKRNNSNWKISLQQGIDRREQERRSNAERLIYTPFGIFNTAIDASNATNIKGSTLLARVKSTVGYFWFNKFQLEEIEILVQQDQQAKVKPKKDPMAHKGMAKPLQTPFGLFITIGTCYFYIKENNIMKDPGRKIPKLIKNDPKNYYHITREEYTRLTGKEI